MRLNGSRIEALSEIYIGIMRRVCLLRAGGFAGGETLGADESIRRWCCICVDGGNQGIRAAEPSESN